MNLFTRASVGVQIAASPQVELLYTVQISPDLIYRVQIFARLQVELIYKVQIPQGPQEELLYTVQIPPDLM